MNAVALISLLSRTWIFLPVEVCQGQCSRFFLINLWIWFYFYIANRNVGFWELFRELFQIYWHVLKIICVWIDINSKLFSQPLHTRFFYMRVSRVYKSDKLIKCFVYSFSKYKYIYPYLLIYRFTSLTSIQLLSFSISHKKFWLGRFFTSKSILSSIQLWAF